MLYIPIQNHRRASFSFAAEEYIMNSPDFNDEYFMFWRTNSCLMVGRFQNTIQEINEKFVLKNKTEVVRRNSGGGTIYTDPGCWQFTFITHNRDGKGGDFKHFTRPVINALRIFGINAEFNSRNDLIAGGKKFSGNAQYGSRYRLLHHGAMLYNTDLDNLVNALNVPDEKIRSKGIRSVRDRVTNLYPFMNENLSSDEFSARMIDQIRQDMPSLEFTDEQIREIEKIEAEKFMSWDWNYGKSPRFDLKKSRRLAGGKVEIGLSVDKGYITQCRIFGDFFSAGNISAIEDALKGAKFEASSVKECLKNVDETHFPYMISRKDLLDCIMM